MNTVAVSRIEHQAVGGVVMTRIYNVMDELVFEYPADPIQAMNLGQTLMQKAAEAAAQRAAEIEEGHGLVARLKSAIRKTTHNKKAAV